MMGWLIDLFKEIPTAGVSKERIEFLQTKLTDAEKENATLKEKVAHLETESETFKTRLANLEQENYRLQEQIRVQSEVKNFDEYALQIVRLLAQNDSHLTIKELEMVLKLPRIQVQYSVDNLLEHRFLQSYRPKTIGAVRYGLSQTGRSFALKNSS